MAQQQFDPYPLMAASMAEAAKEAFEEKLALNRTILHLFSSTHRQLGQNHELEMAKMIQRALDRHPGRREELKMKLRNTFGGDYARQPWGDGGESCLYGALRHGLLGYAGLMLELGA